MKAVMKLLMLIRDTNITTNHIPLLYHAAEKAWAWAMGKVFFKLPSYLEKLAVQRERNKNVCYAFFGRFGSIFIPMLKAHAPQCFLASFYGGSENNSKRHAIHGSNTNTTALVMFCCVRPMYVKRRIKVKRFFFEKPKNNGSYNFCA